MNERKMTERKITTASSIGSTRRQIIASGAVALASLAATSATHAPAALANAPQTAPEKRTSDPRTAIHEEHDFKTTPQRIYEIFLDSKQFAAMTGLPAEISRDAGGAFTMFGGQIVGRNIELVPDARIVQAWRPTHWDAGEFSIVEFQLRANGAQTKLVLDHKGFPAGDFASLTAGWNLHYWQPLTKFLAQS
jgi:activator of HSP90 ATPase